MVHIKNTKLSTNSQRQIKTLLKNKDLLYSFLEKTADKTNTFSSSNTLLLHQRKKQPYKTKRKKVYGKVSLKCAKRNIYLSLADSKNQLKATISSGYLKVKGKARKAIYFIKKLSNAFVELILKFDFNRIHLSINGYIPRKIKRIFLKDFKKQKKKFKVYKFTRRLKSPHNGCRPPKMRRK